MNPFRFALDPRIATALWLAFAGVAPAQPAPAPASQAAPTHAGSRYEYRADHDPNGIGKFYHGREIAHVMGHQAADWLERPEREREERPDLLLEALDLKPGMTVADIGAGTVYHTLRMARRIGPTGRVQAVDVQPEMLEKLAAKARAAGVTNVTGVLGTERSAQLQTASVDLALMVDVYHEFEFPFEMMESICRAVKPGGRVVFVEFRAEDPKVPIKTVHKMSEAQVRKEMADLPLRHLRTVATLPWQHVLVFERTTSKPGTSD